MSWDIHRASFPSNSCTLSKTVYIRAGSKREKPPRYRIIISSGLLPLPLGYVLLMQANGSICKAKREHLRVVG